MKTNFEKEIYSQSDVFKTTMESNIDNVLKRVNIKKFKDIDIIGCGSALFAALIGTYFIDKYTNININAYSASEYAYYKKKNKDALLIVVSQSGETKDTIVALNIALEMQIKTLSIVNNKGTISDMTDECIITKAGKELSVATSKALTAQIATFYKIMLYLTNKNYVHENLIINENNILDIAKNIKDSEHLFVLGRGLDYYVGLEGTLKFKEVANIYAETYSSGEFKHGSISLLKKGFPVIFLLTEDKTYEQSLLNLKEIKEKEATIILVKDKNLKVEKGYYDYLINLNSKSDITKTVELISKLQLISLRTGELKNLNIDNPRFLTKSITTE
jgi:glucosamine--fructose-6-phosphate aminotransferase (isomerizing)